MPLLPYAFCSRDILCGATARVRALGGGATARGGALGGGATALGGGATARGNALGGGATAFKGRIATSSSFTRTVLAFCAFFEAFALDAHLTRGT